jgi:hypothetical protein
MRGGHRLLIGVVFCAAATAAQPPPAAPTTPPGSSSQTSSDGVPDDDFIEFLGADDVGEAWWEFLKKVPPRGDNPPATPPPEAKQ